MHARMNLSVTAVVRTYAYGQWSISLAHGSHSLARGQRVNGLPALTPPSPRAAMSGSESDAASADPHHRIPRGASDEDIDSDGASGYDSDAAPAAAGGSGPVYDDDGLLVSGGGDKEAAKGSREAISKAAQLLRLKRGGEGTAVEVPSSDEEEEEIGEVGDDVLAVATGRRDFAERARRRREAVRARAAARDVVAGDGEEGLLRSGGGGGEGGHAGVLQRMMGVLEGERGGMGELKKKLDRVSGTGGKALDAPLPAVVAGRVERAVAYGKTVEEVGKWAGVVRKHRNEKQLVFPLNEPGGGRSMGTREVGERFKPGNEFEAEVAGLLKEAGVVTEEGVVRVEEEALAEAAGRVSKEDLIKRRRELARMRSVVFENDRKLKRIKKIKSRKFRKVQKMEKAKVAEEARAAGLVSESDEDEGVRAERDRAEERMTLRHKNTSKWVKRQLSRGEVKRNSNAREAVEEQLRIGEELRRKMEHSDALNGRRDEESGSESESGSQEEGAEESLAALRDNLADGSAAVRKKKGLMGLKFMQDAQERRRKEAVGLLDEMEKDDEEGSNGGIDEEGVGGESVAKFVGKGQSGASVGRLVFSGKRSAAGVENAGDARDALKSDDAARGEFGEGVDENNEGEVSGAEALLLEKRVRDEYASTPAGMAVTVRREEVQKRSATEAVALAARKDEAGESARGHGFTTTLDGRIEAQIPGARNFAAKGTPPVSHAIEAAGIVPALIENPWLKPVATKRKRSSKKVSAAVEELVVSLPKPPGQDRAGTKRMKFDNLLESTQGHDVKHQTSSQSAGASEALLKGADLEDDKSRMLVAARAFAGAGGADLADFEAAKEAEIERSLPTAKDIGAVVLPGWGGWAGAGDANPPERKGKYSSKKGDAGAVETPFAKVAREKLEAARAQALAGRADGRLSHVIVSARRAKKAADLTMASVPFPYTSAEQWEQEVAAPLVRERLTASSHSAAVKTRIAIPRGEAVQPLRMSIAQMADRKKADKSGAIRRRGNCAQQRDGKRRSLLG